MAKFNLKIDFSSFHNSQLDIAKGFKSKSVAEFKNCIVAIDRMLIWINNPPESENAKQLVLTQVNFSVESKNLE